ncbi:MAG: HAMP domain-containing histidine kinase [Clostridia bacterium]|nr:HAMP domain-containing histidine kinase [Clostridia bacterium]
MALILFMVNTLYTYLFNQRKMELLTSANIMASIVSENYTNSYISMKLPQLQLEKNTRAIAVDTDSRVIYDSYYLTSQTGKYFINSSIIDALSPNGKSASQSYREDGDWYISATVPVVKNAQTIGAIYLLVSGDSTEEIIIDVRNYTALLGVLIIVFVGIFSLSMAKILTLPIEQFTGFINSMPHDKLQKTEIKTKDEIGQLAIAFNSLIDRIDEMEEKRKAFVSDASHELKTPLSIIKLLSDSLIQTDNPDPEFVKEFLNDMNKEVERLTRIIERLLDMTQLDSSGSNVLFVHTDLKEVLDEIYKKLIPLAENKNIALSLNMAIEDVLYPIERDSFTEAIYNITDNSIKYTESGGSVSIDMTYDTENVYITVRDTGIGIPKEEQQKIFDRFYRVDKARARDTGGTGLGLAIALDAIKLHGGNIEVQSEVELGSAFTIVLPLKKE